MCGIIAYKGKGNAVDIVVDGLKRLEYRGYDSAGLAVFDDGKKAIYQITCSNKCAGKLRGKVKWEEVNLTEMLKIKTVIQIANELGCSDGAVHKRLRKLGLR